MLEYNKGSFGNYYSASNRSHYSRAANITTK